MGSSVPCSNVSCSLILRGTSQIRSCFLLLLILLFTEGFWCVVADIAGSWLVLFYRDLTGQSYGFTRSFSWRKEKLHTLAGLFIGKGGLKKKNNKTTPPRSSLSKCKL